MYCKKSLSGLIYDMLAVIQQAFVIIRYVYLSKCTVYTAKYLYIV